MESSWVRYVGKPSIYTQELPRREAFAHRSFCVEKPVALFGGSSGFLKFCHSAIAQKTPQRLAIEGWRITKFHHFLGPIAIHGGAPQCSFVRLERHHGTSAPRETY